MSAGIVSYGVYIPKYRIRVEEIARVWGDKNNVAQNLNVFEKSVPDADEDTITISVEAARNAINRAGIDPTRIGAIYVGSESHPYAVKPTGTIVGEAIGVNSEFTAADFEFACKAGTAAMQACLGMVSSGMIDLGVAIGVIRAKARPETPSSIRRRLGGQLTSSEEIISQPRSKALILSPRIHPTFGEERAGLIQNMVAGSPASLAILNM